METTSRQFMVKRLAAVKQRRCYIDIFKLIVEHKVAYTVNRVGVLLNLSPLSDELVRQIDEILKRASSGSNTAPADDKYTYGMVGVVITLTRRYRLIIRSFELLYGLRRLRQLALEFFFPRLASP